jgi:hypothetical protein
MLRNLGHREKRGKSALRLMPVFIAGVSNTRSSSLLHYLVASLLRSFTWRRGFLLRSFYGKLNDYWARFLRRVRRCPRVLEAPAE